MNARTVAAALFAAVLLAAPLIAQVPAAASAPAAGPAAFDVLQEISRYDVVQRTPGGDPAASLPIGNGEVGANVWSDAAGHVSFYVSRTDAFSEASRLLKLGKVTIALPSPPIDAPFEERLRLADGSIAISWGDGDHRVAVTIRVDAEADRILVTGECASGEPVVVTAETWRKTAARLTGETLQSSWTMKGAPEDVVVSEAADTPMPLTVEDQGVGFYHRNGPTVVAFTAARQGLSAPDVPPIADPLAGRTFGLMLAGDGFSHGSIRDGLAPVLVGPRKKSFALTIAAPTVIANDANAWIAAARSLLRAEPDTVIARTNAFWAKLWNRAFVFVAGDPAHDMPAGDHPLRIGCDADGGNRFVGSIRDVRVTDGDEVLHRADAPALPATVEALRGRAFRRTICLSAVIRQDPAHPIARILDRISVGGSDGFLFDTYPGSSLRFIVGTRTLEARGVLPAGRTAKVGAVYEPETGAMRILCDGKTVAENAGDGATSPTPSRVTRAWLLQRFVQAAGGRGAYPIKFNGSIFTVDPEYTGGPKENADWRKWGDCFWWQNTRLPYYPMLAQGDFEMMEPLFRLYRATLPVAKARVQRWYGGKVQGAYWPETMTPFGTHANGDYGWNRDGLPHAKVLCPWWEYVRNQGLELVALMLDRADYDPDPRFVREELLPIAEPVLDWFLTAYPSTDDGKLRVTPTQSLETYWTGVENDMPTIAGLHAVLPRLLAFPADILPAPLAAKWRALAAKLPPLPLIGDGAERRLAPAAKFRPERSNCESPELYAIVPFRLFCLGRPDIDLARRAYDRRIDRFTSGWPQDGQNAAMLGLTEEARRILLAKVANAHPRHRFPAMWGPNFDWCPDQDHGSNLLDQVERMLLQCDGEELRLLPAWPKDWDVHFRLHGPGKTTIEAVYEKGEVKKLVIDPPGAKLHVR